MHLIGRAARNGKKVIVHARDATGATQLVLRTRSHQPSLWAPSLGAELLELPELLAKVDRLLDGERFFVPSRDHFHPTERPSIQDLPATDVLSIDRWVVLGCRGDPRSGSPTPQRHPERVAALVPGMMVTRTRREVEWATRDMGGFVPAAWERFR